MSSRLRVCLVFLLLLPLACKGSRPTGSDVLLITIDTLRADYVHAYGFPLEITPTMDALAARGALFENAIAAATLTAPAHASIMTSRYVREHSIGSRNGDTRLEGVPTLAERFAEAGYETAAFVSNAVLRRKIGLDRGFDVYNDELPSREKNRDHFFERVAEATALRAMEWLAARPPGQPIFVWLHLQDPHGPYLPPEQWSGRVGRVPLAMKGELGLLEENSGRAGIPLYQALGDLRDPGRYAGLYAEEIQYADHWAGQVISAVEARSGERGSVILLTADHGESLGESGWFFQHGQSTAPELARVPLMVAAPGLEPARFSGTVSHVDIAPTLLSLAGLPALAGARGQALDALLRGEQLPEDRLVFCDTDGESAAYGSGSWTRLGGPDASDHTEGRQHPVRFESVRRSAGGKWRPAELDARALGILNEYLDRRVPLVGTEPMEPEYIEQLRALGYVDPLPAGTEGEGSAPEATRDGS
ncbi:MAG: sulfatase [Myxococcota bacterium]|nr:sulfatase [Myxococcota bacterium]